MKRHALKIFIGLYIVLFSAVVLLCLHFSSKMQDMKNTVQMESRVIADRLSSTDEVDKIDKPFDTGNLLNRIRSNWTRTPEIPDKDLPTSALVPPSKKP